MRPRCRTLLLNPSRGGGTLDTTKPFTAISENTTAARHRGVARKNGQVCREEGGLLPTGFVEATHALQKQRLWAVLDDLLGRGEVRIERKFALGEAEHGEER